MKREYVKGNKKHWREIYKYVHGIAPKPGMAMGNCGSDKSIYIKNSMGGFILYINSAVYDAITTNPNWHEIKPWETHYEPKPFDKVLGWNDNYPSDIRPDIFFYKQDVHGVTRYYCASGFWDRIKPYNEEEYLERAEEI